MPRDVGEVSIALRRASFGEREREVVRYGDLVASAFRYDTGVEAIRLSNARGSVVVLPYLGQIVWSAAFDGVELAMQSMFREPRPAKVIVETYGCLAYHAGLLRNGVPSPADTHSLHGEMPCAEMDEAGIACGVDEHGPWIAVTGLREYAMGFGAHYRATPRVNLRPDEAGCEIVMTVENLSAAPMNMMYICHVNFAFAAGGRLVQPVPFTPEHVVTRSVVPRMSWRTPEYRAFLADLTTNPSRLQRLTEPERYDPEQVFYIKGLKRGEDGLVRFMLLRREGDGFAIALGSRSDAPRHPLVPPTATNASRRSPSPGLANPRAILPREAQGQRARAGRRRKGGLLDAARLRRREPCGGGGEDY